MDTNADIQRVMREYPELDPDSLYAVFLNLARLNIISSGFGKTMLLVAEALKHAGLEK